jgi:hypothetical protein
MGDLSLSGDCAASARLDFESGVPDCPGLYIVEPLCEHPVSVNANDPRMAERCLKVTRGYIKVGKAGSLRWRERGYQKIFGADLVRFRPLARLVEPKLAERCMLLALSEWRQRSPSGRRTEWLLGISADEAADMAFQNLTTRQFAFEWLWRPEE